MYMNYDLLDDGGNTTYAFDFVNSADFASVHAPQVTEVSPNNGPLPGGSEVSITGIGFSGATDVKFGGVRLLPFGHQRFDHPCNRPGSNRSHGVFIGKSRVCRRIQDR